MTYEFSYDNTISLVSKHQDGLEIFAIFLILFLVFYIIFEEKRK